MLKIGPIAVHLPSRIETNEMLQEQYPRWDLKLIEEKTGIRQRHNRGGAGNFQ